jgi:hypothetical protein
MTVAITLDPVCDDTDGVVTLTYLNYSLIPVQTAGSLTFTIGLTQPTSTHLDSNQTVTLAYTHGTHINSIDFTVFYNGCGNS